MSIFELDPWLILPVVLVCYVFYRAFLYRVRGGKLHVQDSNSKADRCDIETDFGQFSVWPRSQTVVHSAPSGRSTTIPFSEINGVEIRREIKSALLAELVQGYDIWDFDEKFRDTLDYSVVSIRLRDGREFPVFAAGQLTHREPTMPEWLCEVEKTILGLLHLFKPAELRAQLAYRVFRNAIPVIETEGHTHA